MFQRIIGILAVTCLLSMPAVTAAQEQLCTCFCGIEGEGALQFTNKMTATDCQSDCSGKDGVVISCAANAAQFPGQNPRCFDELTCTNQHGKLDTKYQPAECLPGQYYCYPSETDPVTLAVSIGNTRTVTDLGNYLGVLYQFGWGVATTIAIVFVMIGGLQYVLAAGSGDTAKAKSRIRGAVAGLLLLLFAYTILYTVNPQLVRLDVPKFPMVRRIEFISGAQTCDYLLGEYASGFKVGTDYLGSPYIDKPYKIDDFDESAIEGRYGAFMCGSISVVVADVDGNAVAEGTTCQYEGCKEDGQACYGSGDQAQCLTCTEMIANAIPGLSPSATICDQLTLTPVLGEGDVKENHCFYTHDPWIIVSGWTVAEAALAPLSSGLGVIANYFTGTDKENVLAGLCAEVIIDCGSIRSCDGYEGIKVTSGTTDTTLQYLDVDGPTQNPVNLQTVCTNNPCRETIGNCEFVEGYFYHGCDAAE